MSRRTQKKHRPAARTAPAHPAAGATGVHQVLEQRLGARWVLVFFLLLALIYTFPLPLQLGGAVMGQFKNYYGDVFIQLWEFWAAKFQLINLHADPFRFDMLCGPYTQTSLFSTHKFPFLMFPFTWLFGPLASMNLFTLANFLLGGLCTWLLVRELTGRNLPGVLAGVAFAFCPYAYERAVVHLSLSPLWPLSLLAYLTLRFHRRFGWGNGLLLGLGLVLLAAINHPYYYIFVPLFWGSGLLVIFINRFYYDFADSRRIKGAFARVSRRQWLIAWAVVLALIGGGIAAYVLYLAPTAAMVERPLHWQERLKLSWANYLLPGVNHPLFGRLTSGVVPIRRNVTESTAYIGWVPLLMALWGLKTARRDWRMWVFLVFGLVSLSITLGPYITLGQLKLPMPSLLLHKFASFLRAVGRYCIFVQLAVAVLAGYGLADLMRRWREGRRLDGLLAGAMLALAVEFLHPSVLTPVTTRIENAPALYQELARLQPGTTVFEYPPCAVTGMGHSDYLFYQTLHQQPLFNRFYDVTRIPPEYFPFWQDLDYPAALTDPASLAALRFFGVEYVSFHDRSGTETASLPAPDLERLEGLDQVGKWDKSALYRLTAEPATVLLTFNTRPFYNYSELELKMPEEGFDPPQLMGAGEDRLGWRVMLNHGRIKLRSLIDAPQKVDLLFRGGSFEFPRSLQIYSGDSRLAQIDVGTAPGEMRVPALELPPLGTLELTLICPEKMSRLSTPSGTVTASLALAGFRVVPSTE